jgi:alanyl-tRNA synthetase
LLILAWFQFKNVFTGLEKRDYVRATTSQKCVRAGVNIMI